MNTSNKQISTVMRNKTVQVLQNISLLYHNGEIDDAQRNYLTVCVQKKDWNILKKQLHQLIPICSTPELIDGILDKLKEVL